LLGFLFWKFNVADMWTSDTQIIVFRNCFTSDDYNERDLRFTEKIIQLFAEVEVWKIQIQYVVFFSFFSNHSFLSYHHLGDACFCFSLLLVFFGMKCALSC
jgi:hypothetical protein